VAAEPSARRELRGETSEEPSARRELRGETSEEPSARRELRGEADTERSRGLLVIVIKSGDKMRELLPMWSMVAPRRGI
jgi:hypothetical protein